MLTKFDSQNGALLILFRGLKPNVLKFCSAQIGGTLGKGKNMSEQK